MTLDLELKAGVVARDAFLFFSSFSVSSSILSNLNRTAFVTNGCLNFKERIALAFVQIKKFGLCIWFLQDVRFERIYDASFPSLLVMET